MDTLEALATLARPFPSDEISHRVGNKKGQNYTTFAYLDARQVAARLSEVDPGWQLTHRARERSISSEAKLRDTWVDGVKTQLPFQEATVSVEAFVTLWLGETSATRSDVGTAVGWADDENLEKSAYSDAFKRAAVHFGVGAYLYSMRLDPIPQSMVQYGAISANALANLKAQYEQAIGVLTISEQQVQTLHTILVAAGAWEDSLWDALRAMPSSSYERAVQVAAEKLTGKELLKTVLGAEEVSE